MLAKCIWNTESYNKVFNGKIKSTCHIGNLTKIKMHPQITKVLITCFITYQY